LTNVSWNTGKGKKRARIVGRELDRINGRIHIRDRAEKYARMSVSPFTFYRGTAHLFYRDLAVASLIEASDFDTAATVTWVQGDLHLLNFGAFCDADGEIVFDINDFDEAWIASYLFDLWRGAVSICLQGRELGHEKKHNKRFIKSLCKTYIETLTAYAANPEHDGYAQITADNSTGPLKKFLIKAEKRNSREEMLDDWTELIDGRRRFKYPASKPGKRPKLAEISEEDRSILTDAIGLYKDRLSSELRGRADYFTVLDAARRLDAGIGSLGTPRYYVLVRGETDNPDEDHILDVKEQGLPSFFHFQEPDARDALLDRFDEDRAGARVAQAQKAMLMDPDPTLGSITILGRSFSVRERSPFKKSFKVDKLTDREDFTLMAGYWGTILGTAHARGNDGDPDLVPHAFERAVVDLVDDRFDDFVDEVVGFARAYADQVTIDHALFLEMLEKDAL